MATYYLDTFVGVADGSQVPSAKADGRNAGAKESTTFGNKLAGQAWAIGDFIYAGRLRQGEQLISASGLTDTTLGAATLSLGTLAAPTKYINAKTLTVVDLPTPLGPKAATAVLGPETTDQDLYWTVGAAAVAGGTNLQLVYRFASIK
jgi:hypothetical protein